MSRVIIRKAEYNYNTLKPVIFGIMDSLGGDQIQRNSRVVIKPNLLAPASPDKAIVTHPLIIRTVVEYILDKGAKPQISDSSAVGSFGKVLRESGIKDELAGLNVEYKELKNSVPVDVGKPFEKIEIATDAVNTHAQMLLTLGIKNLFGCIVGLRKPEWHLRTGVNREMFAQLLVKIYQAINPSITIIDGILSMQGQGPGKRGEPRQLGVILGSKNAAALDITVCNMIGISPERVLTNKIATEQGLAADKIIIDGDLPQIKDFNLPEIVPIVFGPKRFHGFMRRHLVQRPECAEAITHKRKKVHFNYDKCIRCYCCIEVCPHGALKACETLTGKMTRKVLKV
jgi:uncharacterized protein (DUF362 family)/NAD-dependent dihydropyrimidine dehydrogenase PreA subunit